MKKRYYNQTTKEWYTEGQSLTRRVNGALFSGVPSVEQLTAWGFVEWHEPEPTPEQLLQQAKDNKIAELEAYNNSDDVNEFTIGGTSMWLNFDERSRLQKAVEAKEALGKTTMSKNWNGKEYPYPIAVWKQMLAALEDYAFDCQNATDGHKAAIQSLQTREGVEEYDFTTGYPDKLEF